MARVEEVKYPICIHSDRSVNCGERKTTVIFQTQNKLHLILTDRFLFPDKMIAEIYPSSGVKNALWVNSQYFILLVPCSSLYALLFSLRLSLFIIIYHPRILI